MSKNSEIYGWIIYQLEIVTAYKTKPYTDTPRLKSGWYGVRIPASARYFSLLQVIQTERGAHSASCTTGTTFFVPEIKRSSRDAAHSSPSSIEVKNEWSCTSTAPIRFHGVDRDKFSFISIANSLYFKLLLFTFLGYSVAQLVEAMCYKPEGRGFESQWGISYLSLT